MNNETEKIKKIIEEELEQDFEMGRLRPQSRIKHLKEHIFFKIDKLFQESSNP